MPNTNPEAPNSTDTEYTKTFAANLMKSYKANQAAVRPSAPEDDTLTSNYFARLKAMFPANKSSSYAKPMSHVKVSIQNSAIYSSNSQGEEEKQEEKQQQQNAQPYAPSCK